MQNRPCSLFIFRKSFCKIF